MGAFDDFSPSLRIPMDASSIQWMVLESLLADASAFYLELAAEKQRPA